MGVEPSRLGIIQWQRKLSPQNGKNLWLTCTLQIEHSLRSPVSPLEMSLFAKKKKEKRHTSVLHAITNWYKYLSSTNLWGSWVLHIQPERAVYLRCAPGEGQEGRCQEQCHCGGCQFAQCLCTTKNRDVQEKPSRSVDPLNLKSKCEGTSSPSFFPVLLPNLLLLSGYFSFDTQSSDGRMSVKSNILHSLCSYSL